jgi:hypothetical protein
MQPRAAQPGKYNDPSPQWQQFHQFHRAHTSIGAGSAGHWIKMAGILSPLVIGELVKDSDKRWRWIRIASVATALISEGIHTQRLMQERREREREWQEHHRH